jgi:4,5-DOPA dioxygenase extradiol
MTETNTKATPAIFLAHGSPFLLEDAKWVGELGAWARALPRPRAVLMLSAHWVDRPITIGATRRVPLVYDFYGFPAKYYQVTYDAPPAPELATRLRGLLGAEPVAEAPERGLDHGAYVPLICMYPAADVPVLQVSLPTLDPKELFALGRTLAPLRREGILIVGSGFLTHNLPSMDFRPDAPVPAWAAEFDAWTADVLTRRDVDALLDYRGRAPGVRQALPTHEHFVPVITALGAAIDDPTAHPRFPISGFTYGSATRRSLQLG